ncbi:MAG: hypothetical protein GDA38_08320 [Hormoscilla sp. SP12CHS1]|nr:hypothetical protein [Hormoscilla sp. SP12CHS1]
MAFRLMPYSNPNGAAILGFGAILDGATLDSCAIAGGATLDSCAIAGGVKITANAIINTFI